jgi:hypothetical protein
MDNITNDSIIYPNLEAAAAAVCSKWFQQQGYTGHFYSSGSWWAFPPQGVMPVRIHDVIDLEETKARRVQIEYYSISLSIALLPDGCIAPHAHPEI